MFSAGSMSKARLHRFEMVIVKYRKCRARMVGNGSEPCTTIQFVFPDSAGTARSPDMETGQLDRKIVCMVREFYATDYVCYF